MSGNNFVYLVSFSEIICQRYRSQLHVSVNTHKYTKKFMVFLLNQLPIVLVGKEYASYYLVDL